MCKREKRKGYRSATENIDGDSLTSQYSESTVRISVTTHSQEKMHFKVEHLDSAEILVPIQLIRNLRTVALITTKARYEFDSTFIKTCTEEK